MTPHVVLKQGAETRVMRPAGFRIVAAIDRAAQLLNIIITITSGSEDRGRDSIDPHMTGEAFDISVIGIENGRIRRLYTTLKSFLGAEFTVLLECPSWLVPADLRDIVYVNDKATALHIHIQRRKGTIWPPPAQS